MNDDTKFFPGQLWIDLNRSHTHIIFLLRRYVEEDPIFQYRQPFIAWEYWYRTSMKQALIRTRVIHATTITPEFMLLEDPHE